MNQPQFGMGEQPMYRPQASWVTDDADWRSVRDGLDLIFKGILLMIVGSLIAAALIMGNPMMGLGLLIVLYLGIGGMIMYGYYKCTAVPESSGLKGKMKLAFACFVVMVVLTVISSIVELQYYSDAPDVTMEEVLGGEQESDMGSPVANAIDGVASIVSLVGMVAFLLFLSGLGSALGNYNLAKSAMTVLKLSIGAIIGIFIGVLMFLPAVFAMLSGEQSGLGMMMTGVMIMFIALIVYLIAAIWFIVLISKARNTVDYYLTNKAFFQPGAQDYGNPGAPPFYG